MSRTLLIALSILAGCGHRAASPQDATALLRAHYLGDPHRPRVEVRPTSEATGVPGAPSCEDCVVVDVEY